MYPRTRSLSRALAVCAATSLAIAGMPLRALALVDPTRLISVNAAGQGAAGSTTGGCGNSMTISETGRYVVFSSSALGLAPGATNGKMHAFRRDQLTESTILISVSNFDGAQGNGDSTVMGVSWDGMRIVFTSDATNLVLGDTNGFTDVFLRDLREGTTQRVSLVGETAQLNGPSPCAAFEPDGNLVVFSSLATNAVQGDVNGASDVFVRNLYYDQTILASVSIFGGTGSGASGAPRVTTILYNTDHLNIAFESTADDLVGVDTDGNSLCDLNCDTNLMTDIFITDLQIVNGVVQPRKVIRPVAATTTPFMRPSMTYDSRYVAFESGGISGQKRVHILDRDADNDTILDEDASAPTRSVSVDPSLSPAVGEAPVISLEGYHVVWQSLAAIDAGDTNGTWDVFVTDLERDANGAPFPTDVRLVSANAAGEAGNGASTNPSISYSGWTVFRSAAQNISPADVDPGLDVYAHTIDSEAPYRNVLSGPPRYTNSTTATLQLAGGYDDETVECFLDGTPIGQCEGPITFRGLSDGEHHFWGTATDLSGNRQDEPDPSVCENYEYARDLCWTVDTTDPTLRFLRPTQGVYAGEAQIIPAGPVAIVGNTTVEVEAFDPNGTPVTVSFTIDGEPPAAVTQSGNVWSFVFDRSCPTGCTIEAVALSEAGATVKRQLDVISVQPPG